MLGVHNTVAADWLKLRVVMQSLLAAAKQPRYAACDELDTGLLALISR